MRLIKVGSACLNQTPLDWESNIKNITDSIHLARKDGVSILCMPELSVTGRGCADAFLAPHIQKRAWECLKTIMPHTEGIVVSIGMPVTFRDEVFSTSCLVANNEILGFVAKCSLSNSYDHHYESRWFNSWPKGKRELIEIDGKHYPIGDYHFEVGGVNITIKISDDECSLEEYKSQTRIFLNPSASPFSFSKYQALKEIVVHRSKKTQSVFIHSNLVGNESGNLIYDGSAIIANAGEILATGTRFTFKQSLLTTAVVKIKVAEADREAIPSKKGTLDPTVKCSFQFKDTSHKPMIAAEEPWENSLQIKNEEFARSISLGLFDYLRKSRMKAYVVSLSGGADSSSCSALVYLMASIGMQCLGAKEFKKLLNLEVDTSTCPKDLMSRLLICVYQRSANSSDSTHNSAKSLAKALGAWFIDLDISSITSQYVDLIQKGISKKITWDTDDFALQNIQARVRSPSAWLIANIKHAILLSTGNRSESILGYATMDGDTSGGLSPLGSVTKTFIRSWLKWLEAEGPVLFGPIPALKAVNNLEPTAELKPKEIRQTDETDLMPYVVVDTIEQLALYNKLSPREVFNALKTKFDKFSDKELGVWVCRFFTLWCRNQWKRKRYALAFDISEGESHEFPVLSGGYEIELAEMKKAFGLTDPKEQLQG